MEVSNNKLQRLHCSIKNYDWGQSCHESLVARLFAMNYGSHVIDEDRSYAEFWMSTHVSGPSFLVLDDASEKRVTLKSWLLDNPSMLGQKIVEKWGGDLPFLFKVLSVEKTLSIQAHPDKELAKILHKLHPDVYKDGNHKPEMALAVTDFEALCGFVTLQELKVVPTVPEVMELVGAENVNLVLQITDQDGEEKVKPILKTLFTEIMSATLFLNHVKLTPGEALFLGPNEPHAYIYGECIECMATSDNAVRAGLTPKHRDVKTLCSMLTYKQGSPEILKGVPINPFVNRYIPPFEEFEIDCCVLPQGEIAVFPAVPGPSIFLVTQGEGIMNTESTKGYSITEGGVLFVAATTEISVTSASQLHIYRTGVNSIFFQASCS
ncbi:hypothetical protein VNO77_35001 [Canavalia gladiata]|uniref:mannose-6-phosphate isomerase n=1 Tax=Canavalia gladiata TaxID=3824 RepID=A0AAN9KG28_CANGL